MKHTLSIAAALAACALADASVITLNVTDGGPGVATNATNIGGVVPSAFIENIAANGAKAFAGKNTSVISNLRDDTGVQSGVAITASSGWNGGGYTANVPTGFQTGADNSSGVMMQNYTDTDNGSVTFTGLTNWLSSQGATSFNVYVMTDRFENNYTGAFTIGSETYWLSNGGANTPIEGPFTLGDFTTAADAKSAANTANYVLFSNLMDDSFTLNVSRGTDGNGWINVNAIQIEAVYAAIPEPSTYGMIGAGSLAAIALVRRRTKKKA